MTATASASATPVGVTTLTDRLLHRRITPQSEVRPHRFLYLWNDKPCFARGELVALTGKAKSGKTFFASVLMALADTEPLLGLKRMPSESADAMQDYRVLWIDTEQSEDSTQEILSSRIATLMGHMPNEQRFFVYNLRQEDWQNRLELVNTAILLHEPDLIIFDGIRDVVGDINDYQQAQNVLTKLLSIASFSDACIVCVLHQNKSVEDKTLRGALGTELQNKSFETYECQKDPETLFFTVRQTATRKYDISSRLTFCIDNDGLPHRESERDDFVTNIAISSQETKRSPLNPRYLTPDGMIDKSQLFGYILKDGKRMTWMQLKAVVMKLTNISSFKFADTILKEAISDHIIQSIETNGENKLYELITPQESIF